MRDRGRIRDRVRVRDRVKGSSPPPSPSVD